MADDQAWAEGWQQGKEATDKRQAPKLAHKETEWQDQHDDLRSAVMRNQKAIWDIQRPPENATPEQKQQYDTAHAQGLKDLASSIQSYQDFTKQPGVWEHIRGKLGMDGKPHPQSVTTTPSESQLPPSASGTTELAATPAYTPAAVPSQRKEVPGVAAATLPSTPVASPTLPASAPVTVKGPAKTTHQIKEDAASLQKSQQQANLMASGAPLTPEETSNRDLQAKYSQIDRSPLSPEDKAEAKRKLWGVYAKPNQKLYTLPDGTVQYLDADRPDLIPPGATAYVAPKIATQQIEDYNKAVKDGYQGSYAQFNAEQRRLGAPSTSPINEGREDYAKSHGFKSWTEIPDQYRDIAMNYEIRKQAMDKAYPTSTTSTSYQENYLHQIVPVMATNYRTPQGVETLKDPLWFLAAPAPKPEDGIVNRGGESSSSTPVSPKSPKDVLSEGSSRNPSTSQPKTKAAHGASASIESTWASQNPKPKQTGNVRVEQPIMGKKNKEYDDTQTAVDGAKERVSTMEKNLKSALNGDQQAMLSLVANHIGMTLGAQKGARINQAVWNEAVASAPWAQTEYAKAFHDDPQTGEMVFDGWKGGVNLTPEQMKQMVNLAHERESTLEDSLKTIENRLNSGVANPSSGGPQSPDAIKNEANKKQWAKAPDIGAIEEGSSGKHKYLGGDPTKKENWELVKQ